MKTKPLLSFLIATVVFLAAFVLAPDAEQEEQRAFCALLAQILATLLVALALAPRFRGGQVPHWGLLSWVGIGQAAALYGAVPTWSGHLWNLIAAATLSSASAAIFVVVSSIGHANTQTQEQENLRDIVENANRLDPDPPQPGP